VAIDINRAVLGVPATWWFKKKSRPKANCQYHFNAWRYQKRRSPPATAQNRGSIAFKPHFQWALAFFAQKTQVPLALSGMKPSTHQTRAATPKTQLGFHKVELQFGFGILGRKTQVAPQA